MKQQKTLKGTEAKRTEGNMLSTEGNMGKRTNYFVCLVCKHACLIAKMQISKKRLKNKKIRENVNYYFLCE